MKKIILTLVAAQAISAHGQIFNWAKGLGGTMNDRCTAIESDASGNVYTAGYFIGTVDLDPGPGVMSVTTPGAPGYSDILVSKFDSNGNLVWANAIGASDGDMAKRMALDGSGNILVMGEFFDTVDFDYGPGVYNLISPLPGANTSFVAKFDNNGNILWAGAFLFGSHDIKTDAAGNVYFLGAFGGTVDVDPGPGVVNITSSTGTLCLIKLDAAGNFVWAKTYAGDSTGARLLLTSSGEMVLVGTFNGTADFDPGAGTFNMTSLGMDGFMCRLDAAGDLLWARQFSNSVYNYPAAVKEDAAGNLVLAGTFMDTLDADPGPATMYLIGSMFNTNNYVIKLDAAGALAWAKSYGGPALEELDDMDIDAAGNIYSTGGFEGPSDFDPGAGTVVLDPSGDVNQFDIFVQKLDAMGNFVWAQGFGGFGISEAGQTIKIDNQKNILVGGYYGGTVDFDPSGASANLTGNGMEDAFFFKWEQDTCSDLNYIADSIRHITCALPMGQVSGYAINGTTPYTYSWNTTPADNDSVVNPGSAGVYTVTVTDAIGCTTGKSFILNGPTAISAFDLGVQLVAGEFRPGFLTMVVPDGYNAGCTPTPSVLALVLDTLLIYDSASVSPDIISGDTLKWNYTSLTYAGSHFAPQVFVITDPAAAIGDTVHLHAFITPTAGDADNTNNDKEYVFPVVNGFDPNEKQVYPLGECENHLVLFGQKMTYTVRFQNIGNADAVNIYILDPLDSDLDLSTVRIVANSHQLVTEVLPGNVLKFRFDNIHLPDSTSNEPASHGYVIFEVDQQTGLMPGTLLENTAYIYFDFNPAIVTNTVTNVVGPAGAPCNLWVEQVEQNATQIKVYPNPAYNSITVSAQTTAEKIMVLDLAGRTMVLVSPNSTNATVDLSNLQNGIYLVKVKTTDGENTVKLVKQ